MKAKGEIVERARARRPTSEGTPSRGRSGGRCADQAELTFEQSLAAELVETDRQRLQDIDDALARMEQGSYGICEGTGEPIGFDVCPPSLGPLYRLLSGATRSAPATATARPLTACGAPVPSPRSAGEGTRVRGRRLLEDHKFGSVVSSENQVLDTPDRRHPRRSRGPWRRSGPGGTGPSVSQSCSR